MIRALRRIFSAALTPKADPDSETLAVRSYTRRKPVNAKREALHEQLRAELGR